MIVVIVVVVVVVVLMNINSFFSFQLLIQSKKRRIMKHEIRANSTKHRFCDIFVFRHLVFRRSIQVHKSKVRDLSSANDFQSG